MNSKQLKEQDILQWACQYLPSQRVFNMEFQDGQLISELIYQFYPSIKRLNYTNLKTKMILSLGYLKDFLRDHKIPIDFDVYRIAAQSQQDILKLLYDIRQHFEQNQEHENPQKKKLQNLVKQAENGRNGQPSPVRYKERSQQSNIWYPPSESKSIPRQRSTSIGGGGPRLSIAQQYSSKKLAEQQAQQEQAQSTSKAPILIQQEVTPIQDGSPQNFVQHYQVTPKSQNQTDYRESIQQQIQQKASQQQEIYKFVRIVEELMVQSSHVQEFKRKVFDAVKDVIQRWDYLSFHLWMDIIKQLAQPEDDYLIMAGQMLRAHLGENLSNLQIVPTFSQSLLWQQLIERSNQRTQDAQIQCHLPSRAQSNYQTPNKSILSQYQNAPVSLVDQARGSLQQSPHQSVTKNNTIIGNLSPIPYDLQSSSIQQPSVQSIQQPSLSFHSITEQSSMSPVQAIQQLNENSQNGLQQQNLQQYIHHGCQSEQAANSNTGICKNSPLSYVSAPVQMEQFQQIEQANQFVLSTPKQQGNNQILNQLNAQQQTQPQFILQTPATNLMQSMYPNHTNESNRSIFDNNGLFHFPQQENFRTPQQSQQLPYQQSHSNQQRSSIFQNLFQSQSIQTPQFTEQAQNQNMNSLYDERLVGQNGEKTQLIENVNPFQRLQLDNQNEQQNTNDPSNPLMIQPGQTYNESQSSRGSQYNFQHK